MAQTTQKKSITTDYFTCSNSVVTFYYFKKLIITYK